MRWFICIFAIIFETLSINGKSLEVKKYATLKNVTSCVPHQKNGVMCTFSGGSLPDSASNLSVRCLRSGVLVVQGNIEVLKIVCSSETPIDFEYDGVQPTEALLPLFTKTIQPNVTALPAKAVIEEYFPQRFYNIELTVFGVKAQHAYFHETDNPFLSIKPGISRQLSFENDLNVFTYSRTGRYMFRNILTKVVLYDFYLFFEDEHTKPSFLSGINTQSATLNETSQQLNFPCRPSHHDAKITLTKTSGDNKEMLDYFTDPANGITLNLKSSYNNNKVSEYACELTYGSSQIRDKLIFKYPNTEKANIDLPYGFEGSPQMLPFKDLSLQVTYIFYSIKNVATVRPTCDASAFEGGVETKLELLTNIPCRNPMHCRLMREFVSPKFLNTSYSVEVGKLTEELFSGLRLESGLPFTYGLTMCQSDKNFKAMEYGVSLDGRATAVNYGFDWLKLPGRTKAEIKIYLNIGIQNQKHTQLYAKRNETFRCKMFSSVLIKPVLWLVELNNGSLLFETLDSNFFGDTSYVSVKMESNIIAVHCAASLYYKNFWRRIVLNVNVSDGIPPRILIDQAQENVKVKHGTHNHLLRCAAEGEPLPDLSWEKDGKILKAVKTSMSIILEIPEVNRSSSGEYTCIATNHLKSVRQSVFVGIEYDSNNYWILAGLPAAVFILTVAGFIVYIKFFRKEKTGLSKEELEAFLNGEKREAEGTAENDYVHEFSHTISYDKEFEIPSARFEVDQRKLLGSGAYGMVLNGKVYGRSVAVKTVNRFADKNYLQALLSELKIMIFIGKHESIVELVGAFTTQLRRGQVYIFVELCTNGSAEKYLRSNRNKFVIKDKTGIYQNAETVRLNNEGYFDEMTLTKWALDVAYAMEFLHSKKVIHGDLAARNILITENLKVKVTDFGLSRQLQNYSQYVKKQQEPLPWRWMALESLRDLSFSPQSDAWAYAVLLWELFSLAEVPYPGYTWNLDFVNLLDDGLRMSRPKHASDYLYKTVILECWRDKPQERPTFQTITSIISDFMTIPLAHDTL